MLEYTQYLGLKSPPASAISSRNSMPPEARSKHPMLAAIARVNEPFSWPNSSLSTRLSAKALELIATNGPPARLLQ